jgi:hypothetical protein
MMSYSLVPGFLLFLIWTGCADSSPRLEPLSINAHENIRAMHSMSMGLGGSGDTLIGMLEAYEQRLTWKNLYGNSSDTNRRALAVFMDTSSYNYVLAGMVGCNGDTLLLYDSASYYDLSVPVQMNGSTNVFGVTGSSGVASIFDSISSPSSRTTMTYPTPTDTVSRSNGFTVTWNSGGADTAHVVLVGLDSTGLSTTLRRTVANNGSYFFSSTDLSDFVPGELWVGVARAKFKRLPRGSRQILMTVHSDHIVVANIKN